MSTFLSRVYDCKHRFCGKYGVMADELFLGPSELMELHDYVKELERAGQIVVEPNVKYANTLAGMTIIGLSSDGMRAGVSSE